MALLSVKGLHHSFGSGQARVDVLKGVDFDIDVGELVALMGPSGSGKSTLLNIIGGLLAADEGQVKLGDVSYGQEHPKRLAQLRREGIGWIFQDFHLFDHMSSVDNVAYALELAGMPTSEAEVKAQIALEKVGLGQRGHNIPDELSGGQRQRVGIARAIAAKRQLLVADEPTGNLDVHSGLEVMKLFHDLCEDPDDPISVLMVTHDPNLARRADRMMLMKDGQVVASTVDESWKKEGSEDE